MFFSPSADWASYDIRDPRKESLLVGVSGSQQTLYSFYLFKRQTFLFCCKWYPNDEGDTAFRDPVMSRRDNCSETDEKQLLLGLLFSMRSFCQKLAPTLHEGSTTITPPQEFRSFSTLFYKLHYLESLTGYKFVLMTKPGVPDLVNLLESLYSEVYVSRVLRCFEPDESLELQRKLFREELQSYLSNQYPSLLSTVKGKLAMRVIDL